eukprot:gene5676-6372_t
MTDEDFIEEMKDCYSIFDKVGDMKVEHHRIIDVLRSLGLNPLTEDVNKCLEDSNLVNKRIDFETFYGIYTYIASKPTVGSYSDMCEGLKTLDRDQSGLVHAAELRHILMNIADKMTEEQVAAAILPLETPQGNVPYEKLIRIMMSD